MTEAEKILQKALIVSKIPSSQWTGIQAALRDRAFFSSRIEEARYLYEARRVIGDMLSEAKTTRGTITTREDAVRTIMERGTSLGLAPTDEKMRGGLTDPSSRARAQVIVDTNAGLAAGYVRHMEDMTLGARLLNPCLELIRSPGSRPIKPRNWQSIWKSKGGILYNGRMIALVEDPIWSKISRFNSPYPPFDYNSGMITVKVSLNEAVKLGVIPDDFKPEKSPKQPGFNDDLKATVPYSGNSDLFEKLKDIFGNQITTTGKGKEKVITWRPYMVSEAFKDNKSFEINLGKPTESLKNLLTSEQKIKVGDNTFIIKDKHWLREKDRHGYDHFEGEEWREYNIPLNAGDLDMLPSLWRNPDRVLPGYDQNSILLQIDTLDGGVLTAIVNIKNTPKIKTYFKSKRKLGLG